MFLGRVRSNDFTRVARCSQNLRRNQPQKRNSVRKRNQTYGHPLSAQVSPKMSLRVALI